MVAEPLATLLGAVAAGYVIGASCRPGVTRMATQAASRPSGGGGRRRASTERSEARPRGARRGQGLPRAARGVERADQLACSPGDHAVHDAVAVGFGVFLEAAFPSGRFAGGCGRRLAPAARRRRRGRPPPRHRGQS
jgi:hypothetical protein